MAYRRSKFPETYDTLPELNDLPLSMVSKAEEYKRLKMKPNKDTQELDKLETLRKDLENYTISPEWVNYLGDAITATQKHYVEETSGYVENLQTETNLYVDGKLQQVKDVTDASILDMGNKKDEFLTYVDDGKSTLNEVITTTNKAKDETITATHGAVNAINNYNMVVTSTKKIYKEYVDSYVDIFIEYPNPKVGWVVSAIDTGIQYRFDGVEWVGIGIDNKIGFNIYVSADQPPDTNTVWLKTDDQTVKQTKVFINGTAPANKTLLWVDTSSK